MTNLILAASLNKLRNGKAKNLMEALASSGAFTLATGKWARDALEEIIPHHDWRKISNEDAIAALELALRL